VFVDEGKLRKVSGRLFADPATEEKFAPGVRRSSRLASIAGATPVGAAGDAETPSGFVTPAHFFSGDEKPENALAAPAVRRGGRGGRGAARGEYGRRESLDGEPSSRRSSEDGGAEFHAPDHPDHPGWSAAEHHAFVHGPAHRDPAREAEAKGSRHPPTGPVFLAPGRFAEGALALRSLLAPLADAAAHLSMFRGAECVASLSRLDARQRDTGYALCLLGKAHAEMVEYQESARAFERARRVDPTRLESCEVYSTVLWHLKRETRLSHLAQECVSVDRLAPQTWCALGNCFSLQKEHETALRFFRRALQLDPKYPYAHTLCGHEYFANEDFEKAMTSYRAAIRLDPRHYNAWYGLGTVYYRQEKYELSEYHFRHALGINSRSSVLFCYLGMAQHALRRTGDALELLQRAVALDAKNPLAKYEKASVLLSDDKFQEALEELEELKTVAPREASVFFLMGRIYKKLGLADQAMVNFSVALDLKPASSDVNLIKSAIEKLHVPDDSEDEDL
jgi:anaphase-promoting complex subunit 3